MTARGWAALRKGAPGARIGADGVLRSAEGETRLNRLFAEVFAGDGARECLDYLRSITILNVTGPAAGDAELRHLEGQRYLVALIERRIDLGRKPD